MSEDMTYKPVPTLADLRNQVAELERQLAQADSNMVALAARNAELAARLAELEPSGFAMANSALIQRVRRLERENAELRADWVDKNDVLTQTLQVIEFAEECKRRAESAEERLSAVPLAAIRYMLDPFANGGTSWAESESHMNTLTAWVKAQDMQPAEAEPDAPLTLAAIDEDGDE